MAFHCERIPKRPLQYIEIQLPEDGPALRAAYKLGGVSGPSIRVRTAYLRLPAEDLACLDSGFRLHPDDIMPRGERLIGCPKFATTPRPGTDPGKRHPAAGRHLFCPVCGCSCARGTDPRRMRFGIYGPNYTRPPFHLRPRPAFSIRSCPDGQKSRISSI